MLKKKKKTAQGIETIKKNREKEREIGVGGEKTNVRENRQDFFSGMHACDCLGRCYYAGLHRGVPRDHEGLEVEGGAPGRLHHSHQSTPGRRGSACKVLFTHLTHRRHPLARNLTLTVEHAVAIAKQLCRLPACLPAVHSIAGSPVGQARTRQLVTDVSTGRGKTPPDREVILNGFPFSASGS